LNEQKAVVVVGNKGRWWRGTIVECVPLVVDPRFNLRHGHSSNCGRVDH